MNRMRSKLFHFFLRNPRLAVPLRRASYFKWRFTIILKRLLKQELPTPDKLLSVSPSQITKYIGGQVGNRFRTRGSIRSGNWDQSAGKFEGWDVYKAINGHFTQHVRWEETEYYRRVMKSIVKEGVFRGETDASAMFNNLDRLFESIRSHGLMRMQNVSKLDFPHWEVQDKFAEFDDVTVAIDRDGRFLLQDGKHRLSIAKILDLPSIPVAVGVRHEEWMVFREEIRSFVSRRGSAYQPFTHPDLQDFPVHHKDSRDKVIAKYLPAKPGTLLDLGAYFGYFCCFFAKAGWECAAVEHHPMHAYFIRKLARAEDLPIDVLEMSLFDIPHPVTFDVVLALNIFHHYLKTKPLFEELKGFLRSIKGTRMLFLETHLPNDPIMHGSYMSFEPHEFAEFVSKETGLANVVILGETTRGRSLFLIQSI